MTRVLIISGDGAGPELEYGLFRMREERIDVVIAAPKKKMLFTVFHQQESGWDQGIERPWYPARAEAAFDDIDPSEFDGLLLAGGRAPVYLRNYPSCREIIAHFIDALKPVSAICRGPILLASSGVTGRRMTGHSLIRPRIEMTGNTFIETQGEPLRDGNIVTVKGPAHRHVWVRELLSMLRDGGKLELARSA